MSRPRIGRSFISKPDLVSTTLIYPMTLTCDDTSSFGLSITGNQFAPLGQGLFVVKNSAGSIKYFVNITGGPSTVGTDIRAAHTQGGAYAAYNGTQAVPCFELPDGTGQGSKIWSGTGAPSSTTVGTAALGDFYERRYPASAPTLVAMSATTANATNTSITVGSGSNFLSGNAVAGDLMIVVCCDTQTTETCTIGSDVGITATSADGGAKYNDGTRRIHVFSHVIQAGDISSNTVTASAFNMSTGTGRRLIAMIFNHPFGWVTTGSLHGCALNASDNNSNTGVTTSTTRTVTGPSGPSVSVAAAYSTSSNALTYLWDSGSSSNTNSDVPGSGTSASAQVSAKPGLGTNTSAATGYTTGGSSVAIGNFTGGTWGTILANWATNTTPPSSNVLYVCSTAGSPGTWTVVF